MRYQQGQHREELKEHLAQVTHLVTGNPQHLRLTLTQGAGALTSMFQQQQEEMNKSPSYSEIEDHRNKLTKLTIFRPLPTC